ncbi:MAG: hypothetical protein KA007_00190 [Candidatus Pacebacteria bacterium]|jgi:hypothetical protein|nr:hypothetical protein [Candidatus Paceibacterota bacterium]
MITKERLFSIVLIHTARTWERLRLEQEFEEMPCDNIGSVEEIIDIAEKILEDKILKQFLKSGDDWDWEEKTSEGFSDTYIEKLAEEIIKENYLE